MTGNTIFISYRRDDSAGHAGRLFDQLSAKFANGQVFMDVDSIHPGDDFVKALAAAGQNAAALIVVIGRNWLTSRLKEPRDFVRLEIAAGLNSGVRLFPVLVQGAKMPQAADLPADIAALANAQALIIEDANFLRGAADLIEALNQFITASVSPDFLGTWDAAVEYSWGVTHQEVFKFEDDDGEILGTASYVGTPRVIKDVKISGNKISFVTKSQTTVDFKTIHDEQHAYSGKLVDGRINFRLQTDSPMAEFLPLLFTATRRLG